MLEIALGTGLLISVREEKRDRSQSSSAHSRTASDIGSRQATLNKRINVPANKHENGNAVSKRRELSGTFP